MVCWFIIYQTISYLFYIPFYVVYKLDFVHPDNMIPSVLQTIESFESAVVQFVKFDFPLYLFRCNNMVPYMILNREGSKRCEPSFTEVWRIALRHALYDTCLHCCICREVLDEDDEVYSSKCCKICPSHAKCFEEIKEELDTDSYCYICGMNERGERRNMK